MNPYIGLLFNQGHLQDPELVRSLAKAAEPAAPAEAEATQDEREPVDDAPVPSPPKRLGVDMPCGRTVAVPLR